MRGTLLRVRREERLNRLGVDQRIDIEFSWDNLSPFVQQTDDIDRITVIVQMPVSEITARTLDCRNWCQD